MALNAGSVPSCSGEDGSGSLASAPISETQKKKRRIPASSCRQRWSSLPRARAVIAGMHDRSSNNGGTLNGVSIFFAHGVQYHRIVLRLVEPKEPLKETSCHISVAAFVVIGGEL